MSKEDLNIKVVTKNLPQFLVKDLTMKEGSTVRTMKEARKLLKQIKRPIICQRSVKYEQQRKDQANSKEYGIENPSGNRCCLP